MDIEILKSLKNHFKVVEKVMGIYVEKLPENQLTKIGVESLKQVKSILEELSPETAPETAPATDIETCPCPISEIIDNLSKAIIAWEEEYNVKVQLPPIDDPVLAQEILISSGLDYLNTIQKFVEASSLDGASNIDCSFSVNNDSFLLNFFDNSEQGNIETDHINALKELIDKLGVKGRINCMQGIGNGLTLEAELVK